jgi:two-component system nitrate/nitrite response regulator NarL
MSNLACFICRHYGRLAAVAGTAVRKDPPAPVVLFAFSPASAKSFRGYLLQQIGFGRDFPRSTGRDPLEELMKDQLTTGGTIRVFVADDTRIHTQLLAEVLRRDGGIEAVSSDSGFEGLTARGMLRDIDVLVVSSCLDEEPGRGLEALRAIRVSHPHLRAAVLLDSSKPEAILEAFRSGARGIFSRHESMETLAKCVHSVHRGQIWANSQQMAYAVEALASSHSVRAVDARGMNLLSKRELEVVRCLAQGLTNREIAEHLGLSQHTIKNYLFRVFDKLGVSSRVELLFMTLSQGNQSGSLFQYFLSMLAGPKFQDEASFSECRKSAEQGAPIAQLALAQMHGTRRANSRDLVQAYLWYLIASEKISQAGKSVSESLTTEELLQAELMAADWLGKAKEVSPPRVKSVVSHLPASTHVRPPSSGRATNQIIPRDKCGPLVRPDTPS